MLDLPPTKKPMKPQGVKAKAVVNTAPVSPAAQVVEFGTKKEGSGGGAPTADRAARMARIARLQRNSVDNSPGKEEEKETGNSGSRTSSEEAKHENTMPEEVPSEGEPKKAPVITKPSAESLGKSPLPEQQRSSSLSSAEDIVRVMAAGILKGHISRMYPGNDGFLTLMVNYILKENKAEDLVHLNENNNDRLIAIIKDARGVSARRSESLLPVTCTHMIIYSTRHV